MYGYVLVRLPIELIIKIAVSRGKVDRGERESLFNRLRVAVSGVIDTGVLVARRVPSEGVSRGRVGRQAFRVVAGATVVARVLVLLNKVRSPDKKLTHLTRGHKGEPRDPVVSEPVA